MHASSLHFIFNRMYLWWKWRKFSWHTQYYAGSTVDKHFWSPRWKDRNFIYSETHLFCLNILKYTHEVCLIVLFNVRPIWFTHTYRLQKKTDKNVWLETLVHAELHKSKMCSTCNLVTIGILDIYLFWNEWLLFLTEDFTSLSIYYTKLLCVFNPH